LMPPILGALRRLRRAELFIDGAQVDVPYYPVARPHSDYTKSFRSFFDAVHLNGVRRSPRVVEFTSSVPGEGKTTVAMSFAVWAAHSDARTLLIDADIRRRSLSRTFDAKNQKGLVDLLLGEIPAQDVIRLDPKGKFHFLPSGKYTAESADLLASESMRDLLNLCRLDFDYVLIDTPPVTLLADAVGISQMTDMVLLVVKSGATKRIVVERVAAELGSRNAQVGLVSNQTKAFWLF